MLLVRWITQQTRSLYRGERQTLSLSPNNDRREVYVVEGVRERQDGGSKFQQKSTIDHVIVKGGLERLKDFFV